MVLIPIQINNSCNGEKVGVPLQETSHPTTTATAMTTTKQVVEVGYPQLKIYEYKKNKTFNPELLYDLMCEPGHLSPHYIKRMFFGRHTELGKPIF